MMISRRRSATGSGALSTALKIAPACLGLALPLAGGAVSARAEIVVGLAAPMAGREQKAGTVMREVAQQAVTALNAKGGVLGESLALVILDDQCSDAGAVAAANTFVQRQAKLVIGHPCARAALAAAQVYASAGIVFIAPATRHPALTEKRAGKTIFRLSGRDDRQAAAAAAWLMAQAGTGAFAIVHDKTAYSRGLAAGVGAAFVGKTQTPPLDLAITAGENVYAPIVAKLKELKPKAVFFAGYPAEADIIVGSLRSAGLLVPVLGSDSLATREFTLQSAARDPAFQVLTRFEPGVSAGVIDPVSTPALKAQAANTALALSVWADAVARAASVAVERVSQELASPSGGAPAGGVTFDASGDAQIASFFAVRWTGKEWIGQPAPP